MVKREKRRTIRVGCMLPARIRTMTGWLAVQIEDLSRRGARIDLPVAAVGLRTDASLLDVARRLGSLLPEHVEIHFDVAGRIVRRLRVVRVERPSTRDSVVLGCLLDHPLEDADALALELVLPLDGESFAQAERRMEEVRRLYGREAPSPTGADEAG